MPDVSATPRSFLRMTKNLAGTYPSALKTLNCPISVVLAVVNGSTSSYSSYVTTATLADVPVTAASTWTAVNITSITVTWTRGNNPATVTLYTVQLSTVSNFVGGTTLSSTTTNVNANFTSLVPDTVYNAQVKAINHSGISTAYVALGSTRTNAANVPTNRVGEMASQLLTQNVITGLTIASLIQPAPRAGIPGVIENFTVTDLPSLSILTRGVVETYLVLFYLAVIVAFLTAQGGIVVMTLAWAYVILRCTHSLIHCTYNKVMHRFYAFLASVIVLALLWATLAVGLAW